MTLKLVTCILFTTILFPFTTWAGLTATEISEIYVAVLNRASEGEGNRYWRTLELDKATTIDVMLETDAARNYFGTSLDTNHAFIEHIYFNTLNKTRSQDPGGQDYWVNLLDQGYSCGTIVAELISSIRDYAPGGPRHDPSDTATTLAVNQFENRVAVSDYMAETLEKPPADWETKTRFDAFGLNVTHEEATVVAARNLVHDMVPEVPACGAFIAPDVWVEFDCYNLAAIGKTTNDDPFTPSWRLIGGYWQWGRKGPDPGQWYDTNTPHFSHGPTGPYAEHANSGPIDGWDETGAPDGSWSDTRKTANDPCPEGFRVPTNDQWQHVLDNNTQKAAGSWSDNATNYTSARFFGDSLMLPAAGWRLGYQTASRGQIGYYWSSTGEPNQLAGRLSFSDTSADTFEWSYGRFRWSGFSVRCIKDTAPPPPLLLEITPANSTVQVNGTETVFVTGGTGEFLGAESSDISVATASLGDNGAVTIHGLAPGVAMITVTDSGGSVIRMPVTVKNTGPETCGAYVAPGVWKEFDCYNLAAIGKTTNDDPFTPSWRLIGGYWIWGSKGPDPGQWYDTNTQYFAHGPTGPDEEQTNFDPFRFDRVKEQPPVDEDAWLDSQKTVNDPCPEGFRIPTQKHWEGVIENNHRKTVGTWTQGLTDDQINFGSAVYFGDHLMLPAAGNRVSTAGGTISYGILENFGTTGRYWSSSGFAMTFDEFSADILNSDYRSYWGWRHYSGWHSTRCIAESSAPAPLQLVITPPNRVIYAGGTATMTIKGGSGEYTTLESSNTGVATAMPGDEDTIIIHGISAGIATITVTDSHGNTTGLPVPVEASEQIPSGECGAFVAPGVWKEFDCYNLAAIGKTTNDDPFTPSWRLIGGYWHWGRKGPDPGRWYDTNTEHFAHGPVGPGFEETNDQEIGGWDRTDVIDGAWTESHKTAEDPCPEGFRVPTYSQWDGVWANNSQISAGTWGSYATNYSSGRIFGNDLFLPAAGFRRYFTGGLVDRGNVGNYWSSSWCNTTNIHYNNAWHLNFDKSTVGTSSNSRKSGFSIRCISE
jgi:uncharacterized protein (TIGR02145 family)